MTTPGAVRQAVAEALGTAFLLTAIVGSGIMAERLAGGNVAIALLGNSLATAGALAVIILVLRPVSGAHLNPVVTLAAAVHREVAPRKAALMVAAQVGGAILGVVAANLMFELPPMEVSATAREGWGQFLAEAIATFGLLLVVRGVRNPEALPWAVGAYIGSAFWFTSSTSFANPAVTLARCLTDSFAGIAPGGAPAFVLAQVLGTAAALAVLRPPTARTAAASR